MSAQKSRFTFTKADGTVDKPLETADFEQTVRELLQILSNPPQKVDKNTFHCFGGTRWIINFSSLNGSSDFIGYNCNIHLSNSSRREHSYNAKTIKPHRFQLVARKGPKNQLKWIGLVYREESGQEIFIPRPAEMDLEEFAKQVVCLLQAEEGFAVEEGSLHFDLNKINHLSEHIRGRIVASFTSYSDRQFALEYIGNPTVIPEPELRTTPHTELLPKFDVPELRAQTRRRVRDVASENDSFGKELWRKTMAARFRKAFPKGAEAFPPNQRLVVCFPGAGGKEADLWLKQGFLEEELVLIERDHEIALALRQKYPKAYVIETNVGSDNDDLFEKLSWPIKQTGKAIAILSFDPEGGMTKEFVQTIVDTQVLCGKEFFFSANFNLKRECRQTREFYAQVVGDNKVQRPSNLERNIVLDNLPGYLEERHGHLLLGQHWQGNYQGDSDATRMYWVMAHFKKQADV